jgi:hypothetical protein
MTHGALPTGSHGAEGDSEQKKSGRKREQFDAVISNTRFNGAIGRLVAGTVEAKALLAVLDELNGGSQKGRYMAEMLALKIESRELATAPFSPHVADFLIEGSRRIPRLAEGLASQMAVTLAAAADNHAYLDTVDTAVGNLLFDLDHPLLPDTRNYLRALTDKIDATRRMQQARAHLPTVPSVYPPAAPSSTDVSPPPPAAEPTPPAPSKLTATPARVAPVPMPSAPMPSAPMPSAPMPVPSATKTLVMPSVPHEVPHAPRTLVESPAHAPVALPEPLPAPLLLPSESLSSLPPRHFPWKLTWVLLGAVTILGLGAVAYWWLGSSSSDVPETAPSASSSVQPAVSAAVSSGKAKRRHREKSSEAAAKAEATTPPVTAKNAGLADVRAAEAVAKSHPVETRPVEAKPVEAKPVETKPVETKPVETKPVETKPVETRPVETRPVETKPVETKPVETKPVETKPSTTDPTPRTPTPTRDIDTLLAELRGIPNDVARIEAKAQEVSRIVARSAKPEAEKILLRLTPEEILYGTESYDTRALEPRRRVVALLLEKVALDKDDTRAALAIEMLGQWAKSRNHGGAAKLTLDQLAEDPVVQSRPRRRQALERVQRSLGISEQDSE